jgi:hypothetical protein
MTDRARGWRGNGRPAASPTRQASVGSWKAGGVASLLHAQGDLAGALPLSERALAISEKALGPEHPDTAMSLNNLALLLMDQADLAGARPLLERADREVAGPKRFEPFGMSLAGFEQ